MQRVAKDHRDWFVVIRRLANAPTALCGPRERHARGCARKEQIEHLQLALDD